MIALEVKINGRRICLAGAETLSVLNAAFTIGGRLGPELEVPLPPIINCSQPSTSGA